MSDLSKISIVLPSLDPDEKLGIVINGLLEHGFADIILVNDGSKAENLHYFTEAAQHPQVHLLHHETNLGKGAALKTAFTWFLNNRPEGLGVVTVDGDNQHHPEDTRACALRMLETGHIILGSRDFDQADVPARSKSGNKITSFVFKFFVGMKLSDTQTGLRAIPRTYLTAINKVHGDRFEYETNMLLEMKRRSFPYAEVKIRTVYIEENKSSHFHAVRDSWRIYKLILAHFFKYTLSSIFSAIVDEGLFILFSWLLHNSLAGLLLTAIPVIGARVVSSLLNFAINRKVVFQSESSVRQSMLRYFCLAVPLALAQMGLTFALIHLLNIEPAQTLLRGIIHALVMTVLFFTSYVIQRNWVFKKDTIKSH